jgi:hypothetical protein
MPSQSDAGALDVDVLSARAVDLIWNAYAGYTATLVARHEVVDAVRTNVELTVAAIARQRTPERRDLEAARALGRRRAGQSVPLESVIQAYRSTERVLLLALLTDHGGTPGASLTSHADVVISTFDLLTDEMIDAYRETSSILAAARQRSENELVGALVAGVAPTDDRLARWIGDLGLPAHATWFAIALIDADARRGDGAGADPDRDDGAASPGRVPRLRRRLAAAVGGAASTVLFGDVGTTTVGLVGTDGEPETHVGSLRLVLENDAAASPLVCGVGEPVTDLREAGVSCRQAIDAGTALTHRAGPAVARFRDVLVDLALAARPHVAQLLWESRIAPLRRHPHLLDTLEAYLAEDFSQSRAARRLFVHVNTVTHRMRRIREITGYDPTRSDAAIEMALGLQWGRMSGEVASAPGAVRF